MPAWFKKSKKNEEYKSRLRQDDIQSQFPGQDSSPNTDDVVANAFDILENFPLWLVEKHNNDETDFINFVQAYYDWLYSHKSGYKLDIDGLDALADIDTAPKEILKFYMKAYASGFPENMVGVTAGYTGPGIEESEVKDFIKGIRQEFYQRKSNEEAYRYFFESLYGITDGVNFSYPKKHMIRLNGGRFEGWKPPYIDLDGDPDTTDDIQVGNYDVLQHLGGSVLNGSLLQDSDWIQDFSYLISTPLVDNEVVEYQNALEELLHPAGLKVIYEQTMDDFIPPGGETTSGETHIMPKISNYYAYKMTSDSSIAGCSGCQGGMGATMGDDTVGFADYYSSISWDQESGSFYYMQGSGITFGGDMNGDGTGWEIDGISFGMEGVSGYGDIAGVFVHNGVSLGAKPNHVYPDWTYDGLTGTQFGDFKMSQIYFLSSPGSSPNAGVTHCHGTLAGCTA